MNQHEPWRISRGMAFVAAVFLLAGPAAAEVEVTFVTLIATNPPANLYSPPSGGSSFCVGFSDTWSAGAAREIYVVPTTAIQGSANKVTLVFPTNTGFHTLPRPPGRPRAGSCWAPRARASRGWRIPRISRTGARSPARCRPLPKAPGRVHSWPACRRENRGAFPRPLRGVSDSMSVRGRLPDRALFKMPTRLDEAGVACKPHSDRNIFEPALVSSPRMIIMSPG